MYLQAVIYSQLRQQLPMRSLHQSMTRGLAAWAEEHHAGAGSGCPQNRKGWTSKIIKSNCQPITTMSAKPCPEVPYLHLFLNTITTLLYEGGSTTRASTRVHRLPKQGKVRMGSPCHW